MTEPTSQILANLQTSLYDLVDPLSLLISNFGIYVSQFNHLVGEVGLQIVRDAAGNLVITYPDGISDELRGQYDTLIELDRAIRSLEVQIRALLMQAWSLEHEIRSYNPSYVSEIAGLRSEFALFQFQFH